MTKPSSLLNKLQKNSKIKETTTLSNTDVFIEGESVPTDIPMINVALSGRIDGGISRGIHVIAGPSKSFKSAHSLVLSRSYLNHFDDDGVMLFYDTEFGAPKQYFDRFGIDSDRVVYTPVGNIEELKFDLANQLKEIEKGDRVIIVIDSVGNLSSTKEIDDALSGKTVADMTRAKELRSFFRTVSFDLNMKDIPLIAINHTYSSLDYVPREVVGGGSAVVYSANHVWIISRRQNKDGSEVKGYDFTINVEKSRFVKEKSKIPITVSWEDGINKYSGLLDCAIELGFVLHETKGWYQRSGEEKKYRKTETNTEEFWQPILDNPDFNAAVKRKYAV